MTRLFFIFLFITANVFSQTDLNKYSFVIVPEQFDFTRSKDQYKLNSMTKFYLEKSGFNVFMDDNIPNANRCQGLYANVEKLSSIFGSKLQVVLRDCNEEEVYRSPEGKSKYKEFDKSYQDALRKAFVSIQGMEINQADLVLLEEGAPTTTVVKEVKQSEPVKTVPIVVAETSVVSNGSKNTLPVSKYSHYAYDGKTFLLRKTAEGYSLYEEASTAPDGLLLKGKIVVMDSFIKYMDASGNVYDAVFDAGENLTLKNGSSTMVFKLVN